MNKRYEKTRGALAVPALALALWGNAWAQAAPQSPALSAPVNSPAVASVGPLNTPVSAGQKPATQDPTTGFTAPASPPAAAAGDAATPTEPQPLATLASVGTDYRIGPNDLLEFDVFGVPDMKRSVRVNSTGVISLPLLGAVPVAGLTAQQAEAMLAQRYAKDYFQNPSVGLFIKEFTTQRVTIEGAVQKPGIYPVTGQITLLRAMALAGGYAAYADLQNVMLYRTGPTGEQLSQTFDLDKVRAGEVPDPLIRSDDVVVVKRDSRRTALRDSLFSDFLTTLNPFR